jgi:lysophospholipase L1-like esterase
MKLIKTSLLLFALFWASSIQIFSQPDVSLITIFMIGNSTMADKPYGKGNPEKGWGQVLPLYFKEGVRIRNSAINGRSTKSYIDEGNWEKVLNILQPGNYLIIEFGHNDAKEDDPKRFCQPEDYKTNLERFVTEAREKGAVPILATPICRRRFDKNKKFYDVHGLYPDMCRAVAMEMNVPLLDLHKHSEDLFIKYGEEDSKKLFLWINPNEYETLPDGKTDNTHFSAYGAFRICDLAVDDIRKLIPELANRLKD